MTKDAWDYFFVQPASLKRLPEWLRAWTTIVAVVCIASLIICLLIICVLLVRLGVDALSASSAQYQEATRNFLLAFASAFGAPFLVWRAWVAHQQARAAAEQARIAAESHVTGIFAKSVELMGYEREKRVPQKDGTPVVLSVPNIEARLGAIYSLERILRESEKDQRATLETLCAYIRENSPLEIPDDQAEASVFWAGNSPPKATRRKDVQAAITVIGRRPNPGKVSLDLKYTNLSLYDFTSGNFDNTGFEGTFLNGANMQHASFERCDFTNSFLRSAQLNGASFQGTSFNGCHLENAYIANTDFRHSTFEHTDLRNANIVSLRLEKANLEQAFGYMTEHAIKDAIDNGPNSFNASEILRIHHLFKKASYDDGTAISQEVKLAIAVMSQQENHYSGIDGSPDGTT